MEETDTAAAITATTLFEETTTTASAVGAEHHQQPISAATATAAADHHHRHEPYYECCICFEPLSEARHGCSGSMATHYRCTDCELAYLRAELAPGCAFDSERSAGGPQRQEQQDEPADAAAVVVVSRPGELPCPMFVTGECDCASLPFSGLCEALRTNNDVAELYQTAFRRTVEAQVRREDRTTGHTDSAAAFTAGGAGAQPPAAAPNAVPQHPNNRAPASTPQLEQPRPELHTVQEVRRAVWAGLDQASMMTCPDCGYPGLKDHACMHITCEGPACSTRWCYCCGRRRRRPQTIPDNNDNHEECGDFCRGCDVTSCFIERQPDWGNYALPGESAGIGARNEFHRRRMLYYIHRIRQETNSALWQEFRQAYPWVLTGVPTTGRSIAWEELEEAGGRPLPPPVFGNTTEDDLLWKLPPLVVVPPVAAGPAGEPSGASASTTTITMDSTLSTRRWMKRIGRGVKKESRNFRRSVKKIGKETRKVLGIGIGTLEITGDKPSYTMGGDEPVTGSLRLTLTEPIPATRLMVQIEASRKETTMRTSADGQSRSSTTNKTLYEYTCQLGGEKTYESGEQFQFSIPLPRTIGPKFKLSRELADSTIGKALTMAHGVHQSMRSMMDEPVIWTISAWLDIPWKVNLSKTVRIFVFESED